VKLLLANVERSTFVRIEPKYIITVASSVHKYRPELCPLLSFDGDPVQSIMERFSVKMRPGLGAWKGDVIDLIGEPQTAASTRKEDWDKASRESEDRHFTKYALYRDAGVRDITMRIRTMSLETIHAQDDIEWYTNFMSPHAGEVIISTKPLKLPAFVHSDREDIGLYYASAVDPKEIPEMMITANFRRNAQPLLQAVWCDQSDSFVFSGTTIELEEDQAYEVQLASFEAELRIKELLDGHEEDDDPPPGDGDIEGQDEVPLLSKKGRRVISQASSSLKGSEEEPVEVVDSM